MSMLADDKDEIRRRLLLAKYPRRSTARVSDAADHNPWVLDDCPRCRGRGKVCEQPRPDVESLEECGECDGSGTNYQIVRYFENDAPVQRAARDADGWIRCPGCGHQFSTADAHAWTGLRHVRCGQRIEIVI